MVWEDLRAWIEQLYAVHHARVEISVVLVPSDWKVTDGVNVRVYKQGVGSQATVLWENWRALEPCVGGSAESVALHLVSRALLELDNRKEEAERALPSLW